MHIESNKHLIAKPANEVYLFICDFRNFKDLLPDQVQHYKANADTCSFEISSMGEVFLEIKERIINQKVRAVSAGEAPIDFELIVNLNPINTDSSTVIIQLNAKLSPMLAMIAKNPLSNFINIMAARLKEVMEKGDGK